MEGLADVLYDHRSIEDVIAHPLNLPRMLVVGPGLRPELAEDGVPGDKAASLLRALRGSADFVIVEAPPTSASADAQTLAALVDATLVVVEPKVSTYAQVLDGIRQLDGVGSEILGGVLASSVRWAPGSKEPMARRELPRAAGGAIDQPTGSRTDHVENTPPNDDPAPIASRPTPES
jgi:Mrp family chromosome partitioning ATPase